MKATELRIGNLINVSLKSGQGRTLQKKIGYDDLERIHNNTGSFIYEPIPLTEDILIKAGFEYDNVFEKYFIYINTNDISTDKLSFRVSEGFICFDGIKYRTLLKHITHLHQLQNLYFALTNQELTIEL